MSLKKEEEKNKIRINLKTIDEKKKPPLASLCSVTLKGARGKIACSYSLLENFLNAPDKP